MAGPAVWTPRAAVLSCLKLQEFQVAEALHCPSCSTRYRLHPGRMKPSHRRARCFSCGEVFPLGAPVASESLPESLPESLIAPAALERLIAAAAPEAAPAPEQPAATAQFDLADVAAALEPIPPAPPSLTLGDLEVTDAEILERTLSGVAGTSDLPPMPPAEAAPAPAAPPVEVAPPPPAAPAPAPAPVVPEAGEDTLTGGGTYSSAKDAISKLFAGLPDLPPAPKAPREPRSMDMEATLSALEATLGKGATPPHLPAPPEGDEPTSAGRPPEEDLHAPSTATMRLSQEDLRAALRVGAPSEPTEVLRATDLSAPLPEPAATEDPGAERLRLKIGEEIYPSLTMAQLTTWIEEGRILEHHLVARQHSENWLEAHKVPGLRPAFERLRRERSGATPAFDSPALEMAPKKGLFGGLFGKN